jgi:DNA-binding NtrC family response regulator
LTRFLQVDDDPIFNAVCARHFSGRDGLDYIQFSSLDPAEELLSNDPAIDVLMLDLSLPDRDGIEFLTLLNAYGFKGKLILMSSQPRNVIEMAATLAAARGHPPALTLSKPVTPEKLAEIDAVLASVA